MSNRGRWCLGVLATAVALLGSLTCLEAQALGLGRLTVQSALGEPLRAEVDIVEINASEAANLKVTAGSPDAFTLAGVDYSAIAASVEVKMQRRPDGRAFLRLTSTRPVTEPFVDMLLEAVWPSGRLSRAYTMLFDPPNIRSNSAGVTAAPLLSPPPSGSARSVAPGTKSQAGALPSSSGPATSTGNTVAVKSGDTAGKIAAQNKPANVSLDQMLVAMLRSNPEAFIGGNVNRVRTGAVLNLPDEQASSAISPSDASQTIFAQSKDFNAFRRKLAERAPPSTQTANADRQVGGKVQAKVQDGSPASTAPDKLTLSKGAVKGKASTAAEEKILSDRQASGAAARVTELSKNISDLSKITAAATAASGTASPAAPTTAPATKALPGLAVPAPSSATTALALPPAVPTSPVAAAKTIPAVTPAATATTAPATPSPGAAASGAAAAVAPSASTATMAALPAASTANPAAAPAPANAAAERVAVKNPVAPAPAPSSERQLFDEVMQNPLMPVAALVLALLAGLGIYRYRKRAAASQFDSSFMESRAQHDSFFGASGGQRIDTNEGNATASPLVYSHSQLDAAGDVDPVAEADVYLAYGRDLQAEEILQEALRTTPARVAIHAKLLEIYAKRRDNKAFEAVAAQAYALTQGGGPQWADIAERGRELDPANPMYHPGGRPTGASQLLRSPASSPSLGAVSTPTMPSGGNSAAAPAPLDFDLDFSAPAPAAPAAPATPVAPNPAQAGFAAPRPAAAVKTVWSDRFKPGPPVTKPDMDADFGVSTILIAPPPAAPAPVAPVAAAALRGGNSSNPNADFDERGAAFVDSLFFPSSPREHSSATDSGMMDFSISSLSPELPTKSSQAGLSLPTLDDPLDTKFQLAEEFRALGDVAGARALAQEVLAKAGGPLKLKAQAFLNALS